MAAAKDTASDRKLVLEGNGGNFLEKKQQTNPEGHRRPYPEENLEGSVEAVVESCHFLTLSDTDRAVRRILGREEENEKISNYHGIVEGGFLKGELFSFVVRE